MKHQLRWFLNRISKRIYRDKTTCPCKDCTDVTHNGIIVSDKQHAEYLHLVQHELDINYRDERNTKKKSTSKKKCEKHP